MAVAAGVLSCGGGKKRGADGDGQGAARAGKGFVMEISDSLIDARRADTLNFGRVREGEQVVREFKVRNAGERAFVITSLDLSCGCIQVDYPKQPMKPGEEGAMKLALDTRNLGGWIFKSVLVQTSLSGKPHLLYVMAEIE